MGLLNKAIDFLKANKKKEGLILLFYGRTSLRNKALLEDFSGQIERENPCLTIFPLSIEKNIMALDSFIQNMFFYKEKYNISILKSLQIWPVFLLPGAFDQFHLEEILKKFKQDAEIEISLLKPLDFSNEVHPFLVDLMRNRGLL